MAAASLRARTDRAIVVFGVAAIVLPGLVIAAARFISVDAVVFLPPVLVNLMFAVAFGQTLRAGREPMIAIFAKRERKGVLPADLARHARAVTWMWTLFCSAMAVTSLALALFGSRHAWSLFTNVANPLGVVALFVGVWAYRRIRYAQYRHETPLGMLRNVLRHGSTETDDRATAPRKACIEEESDAVRDDR